MAKQGSFVEFRHNFVIFLGLPSGNHCQQRELCPALLSSHFFSSKRTGVLNMFYQTPSFTTSLAAQYSAAIKITNIIATKK